MFWNLFLAHLLGDYPLQPMWLVRSKSQIWGLVLHGSIHLLTLLLLAGPFRGEISLASEPGNTRFEVRLPLNFETM